MPTAPGSGFAAGGHAAAGRAYHVRAEADNAALRVRPARRGSGCWVLVAGHEVALPGVPARYAAPGDHDVVLPARDDAQPRPCRHAALSGTRPRPTTPNPTSTLGSGTPEPPA